MTAQTPSTTDLLRSMVKSAKGAKRSLCLADRQFGPFRIENLLGEGSYGEVYRAVDSRYARPVALKILRDPIEDVPPDWAPFEAAALARARHEAVVTVLDVDVIDGHACVAMELLSDETLYTRLLGGYLDSCEVAALGTELCAALAELHARDVVHGDIKPLNIVFDRERRPHLIDFGTAQRTAENRVEGIGSPLYMAPEQSHARSRASDVFNLALTLVEAIAGTEKVMEVRACIEVTAFIEPARAYQQVTCALTESMAGDLASVLAAALAHDPVRRVTARQLYQKLKWCAAPRATLADTWPSFVRAILWLLTSCFCLIVGIAFAPRATGVEIILGVLGWLFAVSAAIKAVAATRGRVVDGRALADHTAIPLPNRNQPTLENSLRTDRLHGCEWIQREWIQPGEVAAPGEPLGRIAGRFTLKRLLWLWERRSGYVAWDAKLQRPVIVEVGPYTTESAESADMMLSLETSSARHALPLLYSSGRADQLQHDVYEVLDGIFLSELLRRGQVDSLQALDIAERIAALMEQLARDNRTIARESLVASSILVRPDGRLAFYAVGRHTKPSFGGSNICRTARLERAEGAFTLFERTLTDEPPTAILASPIRLPDRRPRQPAHWAAIPGIMMEEEQEAQKRRAISFSSILDLVEALDSRSP